MSKERKEIIYDRFDEEVAMEIKLPSKISNDHDQDEISDLYGLDKDDCLDRTYPGVSDKNRPKDE
ncbi:hypothetical protein SAMN05880501_104258 [Ureibacillus xyleni]|uniref:Uncharacterized protein n=1 Tax=Ureibacillus xyleni TaxID=614648 RepID=A0A285SFJ4_9BACL|nr:hypothetical protein [Ureibacillus xyleni]SOC06359.1 hypothetical protein SAMN05880501_104258 [Ureibacillus xyleni]